MKLISSKAFIGRFIQEVGIDSTDFLPLAELWLNDAIHIIGIPNYYVNRYEIIDVVQSKGLLPCDIEHVVGYYLAPTSVKNVNEIDNISLLSRIIIRDAPIINSSIKTTKQHYANVNGRYIYPTFSEGKILIIYKGMPCDKEGNYVIPNDPHFTEAVRYYFIKNLYLNGYTHPIITFNDAYSLWEKHYPRASNSLNWFDAQELQEFTEMWTNPILGDLQLLHNIN